MTACSYCGAPLPETATRRRRYCRQTCRVNAAKRRKRDDMRAEVERLRAAVRALTE